MADAPETLKMLNEFKQQLKAKVKHMEKKSLLVQFPEDPEKLPKEIYDRVFGEELPSPPKGSAGGESLKVVARKSHGLVKKQLSFSDASPMANMMQQMDQMMRSNMGGGMNPMMLMMAGMQQLMGADSGAAGAPHLQIFGTKKKQKALADTAEADQTPTEQKALTDKAKDELRDTQEEEEEERSEKTQRSEAGKKPPNKKSSFEMFVGDEPEAPASAPAKAKGKKTPEDYVKLFKGGVKNRERARAEAKQEDADKPEDDDEAEASEPEEKQPKTKKRKSEPKSAETPPAKKPKEATPKKAKAAPKTAAKAAAKEKKAAAPKKEASAAEEGPRPRKDLGPKPDPPDPWAGTFFWGTGKVHKNPKSNSWRAFVEKSDKIDRKYKIGDDHVASFHRALQFIEEGMHARGL